MKSFFNSTSTAARFFVALFVCASFVSIAEDALAGSFGGSRGSRGGSFGGSRRSGGYSSGSRSNGGSRSSGGGFFSRRPSTSPSTGMQRNGNGSFGGSRPNSGLRGTTLNNSQQYTARYGTPRKQWTQTYTGNDGMSRPYVVNSYGGYGDGLMMGYLMGRTSWMWYTPFHPAFYYSQPSYVPMPNGGYQAYPPTFSFGSLFLALLIFGALAFIVWVVFKSFLRKRGSSGGNYSQSSFG